MLMQYVGRPVRSRASETEEIRPDQLAVLADIPLFHAEGRDFTGKQPAKQAQIRIEIVRIGQLLEATLQQLVAFQAKHVAELVVYAQEAAVESNMRDADRGQIKGGTQRLFCTRGPDERDRCRTQLRFWWKRIGCHFVAPSRIIVACYACDMMMANPDDRRQEERLCQKRPQLPSVTGRDPMQLQDMLRKRALYHHHQGARDGSRAIPATSA